MTVISITITESEDQLISGIPKFVDITTNIPSTIFYTFDNSDPTLSSDIYVDTLYLPQSSNIILKVLATNGILYSPIITETYEASDILDNTRLAHSPTDSTAEPNIPSLFPFGTPPLQPSGHYLNPAEAGINTDDPALSQIPSGFDGQHNENAFTNLPYTAENYNIIYYETDSEGRTGTGISTLPGEVTVPPEPHHPEMTNQFGLLFDPKSPVIFQDFTKPLPEDVSFVNKQFFCLEDPERVRDGVSFFNQGLDAPPVTGSFVNCHYNPRTNTINYYYFDSIANRWIISTIKKPDKCFDGNLAGEVIANRSYGSKFVHEWVPFQRRVLF
jgi:hypothetical protein